MRHYNDEVEEVKCSCDEYPLFAPIGNVVPVADGQSKHVLAELLELSTDDVS
jgi:hypothetical protein